MKRSGIGFGQCAWELILTPKSLKKAWEIALIQLLKKKVEQPGDHAFAIFGQKEVDFIVKNSWGPA